MSRDSNTPIRFECVTRFEHSNQIRISYEIQILQPDSNVSRDSNDSNIPTRFEIRIFEYMRSKSFDRQKIIYHHVDTNDTLSTFPSLVLTNGAHADVAIEILKVIFEETNSKYREKGCFYISYLFNENCPFFY